MRWPRLSTDSTKPSLFTVLVHGGVWSQWNTQRWDESTGSMTGVCRDRLATSRRQSLRRRIIIYQVSCPWQRDSNQGLSGNADTGAVQIVPRDEPFSVFPKRKYDSARSQHLGRGLPALSSFCPKLLLDLPKCLRWGFWFVRPFMA